MGKANNTEVPQAFQINVKKYTLQKMQTRCILKKGSAKTRLVVSTLFWLKPPKYGFNQFWRLIFSLLLMNVREHCKYSTYNCSNSYYNWKNQWNDFCFHWGGSTTPQNGDVRALSVSVPWLDVLHSLPFFYFSLTLIKLGRRRLNSGTSKNYSNSLFEVCK